MHNDPQLAQALDQAMGLHRSGRIAEAEARYRFILEREPHHFDALHLLGLLRQQQGQLADALELFRAALDVVPTALPAISNYGTVLHQLGRHEEALTRFEQVLAQAPGSVDVLMNCGAALAALGRNDEALACFDTVLSRNPNDIEALFNRALAMARLGRHVEAATAYETVLALNPRDAEAHNGRGVVLRALHRHNAALASFDAALALKPDYAEAHFNKANTLANIDRCDEAISSYDKAIAARPQFADALVARGSVLAQLKRHRDAIENFRRGSALAPNHPYAFAGLAASALAICDWTQTAQYAEQLPTLIRNGTCDVDPLRLLEYSDDPSLQLACAQNHFRAIMPQLPQPLWRGQIFRHDRIRIAYLSADFQAHATANLAAGVFECHDRTRFETFGISYGADDGSAVRARLVAAFDQFHDVRTKRDDEVAQLLRSLEIDIAVDLKGYTRDERLRILAHRPCPIQVNYLGYPGTLGVDFIDYVIADAIVLPFDQQAFFTEKIVHLPDCYQPNDTKREIAAETPSREQAGLPPSGFVFCCFNNAYKITAQVFDIWMRLLQRVQGSVLWLLKDDAVAQENLCKVAAARGVDAKRLIFAPRVALPRHLARHRLADLFLDTLPYNAHTTASDALWAGLPVLTCRGHAFAGRVAASLDHAAGLDDLVTSSLEAYETLALRLAEDPALLRGYRDALARNRSSCPLFDTARFCRHIEAAYLQMWRRWQCGEPPQSFAVERLTV
jgi:predicted O-linked N-acetylglucosamine transferase (SPINDLY family)